MYSIPHGISFRTSIIFPLLVLYDSKSLMELTDRNTFFPAYNVYRCNTIISSAIISTIMRNYPEAFSKSIQAYCINFLLLQYESRIVFNRALIQELGKILQKISLKF